MKLRSPIALVVVCASLALPVKADYLYTVNFDALSLTIENVQHTYAADSFSFSVSSLIPAGVPLFPDAPGGELNGFQFSYLYALGFSGGPNYLNLNIMTPEPMNSFNIGDVVGFWFTVPVLPTAVGTYSTSTDAGRIIHAGPSSASGFYTSGSLVITEVPATVPEAGSLISMVIAGVFLALGCRRERRAHR